MRAANDLWTRLLSATCVNVKFRVRVQDSRHEIEPLPMVANVHYEDCQILPSQISTTPGLT